MRQEKVVFFGINGATGFSGGRYHAWLMAEALAESGWDVTYITNERPSFRGDFTTSLFPRTKSIKLLFDNMTSSSFKSYDVECDLLVVVPHMNCHGAFSENALKFARQHNSRILLLNFESANWFNLLSPVKRDEHIWDGWKEIARHASCVLSSAGESKKYAKQFYYDVESYCGFESCWAPINTRVADSLPHVKKEKRIVVFARFSDASHKGNEFIEDLIESDLDGATLVLIANVSGAGKEFTKHLKEKADRLNVTVEILSQLTEEQKWLELKRAAVLLFFSFFEGFGLPPVEAQYVGTPCIAFHLPILEEVSGNGIYFVSPGDMIAVRQQLLKVLKGKKTHMYLHHKIAPRISFEKFKHKINSIALRACCVF